MAPKMEQQQHLLPQTVNFGHVPISRFIIGGNPFSGFSHSTRERDSQMLNYYSMERIKQDLRLALEAGVKTHLGRSDNFIMRVLREHWNEGGTLNWIAQTCPYVGTIMHGVMNAVNGHASCCFIHGGEMDYRVENRETKEVVEALKAIHGAGMVAGVAGHHVDTLKWAADNLDVDFFMACYYNPTDRKRDPVRDYKQEEQYLEEDRAAMCALIQQLPKPAIHYKVLAAGRHKPADAFAYVAEAYRPGDAVCVGIYTGDNGKMIQEDVDLLEKALRAKGK
jgi:hypothetical protein